MLMRFDPRKPETMDAQLMRAIVKAAQERLRGRRFFLEPAPSDHAEPTWRQLVSWGQFYMEGRPVRGLGGGEPFRVKDWTFFIPPGPERQAISVALDMDREIERGNAPSNCHYWRSLKSDLRKCKALAG